MGPLSAEPWGSHALRMSGHPSASAVVAHPSACAITGHTSACAFSGQTSACAINRHTNACAISARSSGGGASAASGAWNAPGTPLWRCRGSTSGTAAPTQRRWGSPPGGSADVAAELAHPRDSASRVPLEEGLGAVEEEGRRGQTLGVRGSLRSHRVTESRANSHRVTEHESSHRVTDQPGSGVIRARGRRGRAGGGKEAEEDTEPQQTQQPQSTSQPQLAQPRSSRNVWRRSPGGAGSTGDAELAAELAGGDLAGAVSGRPVECVGGLLDSLAHTLAPQDVQDALGRLQSWEHALEVFKWGAQRGSQWWRRQRRPGASPWGAPGANPGGPGAGRERGSPQHRGPHALHLALLDLAANLDRGRHFGEALDLLRKDGRGQGEGEGEGEGEGGMPVVVPERQQARLMQRLTAKGRQDLALDLLSYACQGGAVPAVSVARALVGGLQAQGDVEGVVTAVRRIAEAGGRDPSPFNTALSMLSQRGQHRRALDVLVLMQGHAVPMDGYTLSASLAALGRAGRVDEAQALLRKSLDASDEGVPVVACTTMLGILERAGRASECVPLLAHMRAGGLEGWDEAAFTTALNCLGRAGMLDEVHQLLADMKRLKIPVSRRHTLGLVTMYGRHKDLGSVTQAVREGLESGIPLDKELEVQIERAARGAVSHVEARGREQTRAHRRQLLLARARNAPPRQRQALQRVWEHRTLPREGASAVRLLADLEGLLGLLRAHRWRPASAPAWAEVLARLQMMDAATVLPPNLRWLYQAVTGIEAELCEDEGGSPPLSPGPGEAWGVPGEASGSPEEASGAPGESAGPIPSERQSAGVQSPPPQDTRPAAGEAVSEWKFRDSEVLESEGWYGGSEGGFRRSEGAFPGPEVGTRDPTVLFSGSEGGYSGSEKGARGPKDMKSEDLELQAQRASIPEFFWFSCVARHKRAGRWAQARAAYEAMRRTGVAPAQQTLCAMIEVYGALGDVASAEEAMRHVASPDMATLHVMMQVYAAQGRADDAQALFRQIEASLAVSPDLQSYTILLTAYHRAARGADALALFRRMQEHGLELDEVAGNTVINTCGGHMAVEEALGLLRGMQRRKQRPNQVTLNHVLGLLVKAGRMEDAQELFEELASRGAADRVAFCTMADAFGKRRQLERMEGVVRDAAAQGRVSLPLLNATLDAYGKAGLLGNLRNALQRIKSFSLAPDLTSYNILVHAYGMSGMLAEMEETVRQLKEAGYTPDQYTYNILISAYGDIEMPYASLRTLQEMQDSSMVPDVVTYRNLISAFERAGDFLEAARWSMWAKQVNK